MTPALHQETGALLPIGGSGLRLLIVGNPGSVHVRRWARAFCDRGHDVHVAALRDPLADDAGVAGEVHRLGEPRLAPLALRRLAARLRADVLHAHYLTHYGWITWASGTRPYVVTLWGSDILIDAEASRARRLWARLVLRGAALVTADAGSLLDRAILLGAPPKSVREVQFGVDTERFRPGPPASDIAGRLGIAGRRVIFSPRNMKELSRTDVAIQALAQLPEDVVLVATLAGADPEYLRRIDRLVETLGVRDRIRIVSEIPHDEIDQWYRLATAVISVQASDGTPVSILEAMATGVPVVASDLPSVRPWLEDIPSELLVPVDDPVATARALGGVLSLPSADLQRLASQERAIVVARASHVQQMDVMEREYRRLAAK